MGANKGVSWDGTYFQIQKYDIYCPCWQIVDNTEWSGVTKDRWESVDHYVLFSISTAGSSSFASANIGYGNSATRMSHLTALSSATEATGTLEFYSPGALYYNVWVNDGSGFFYVGYASIIGKGNWASNNGVAVAKGKCYYAIAAYPDGTWGSWSDPVCV